jgi:hypothetical protein
MLKDRVLEWRFTSFCRPKIGEIRFIWAGIETLQKKSFEFPQHGKPVSTIYDYDPALFHLVRSQSAYKEALEAAQCDKFRHLSMCQK